MNDLNQPDQSDHSEQRDLSLLYKRASMYRSHEDHQWIYCGTIMLTAVDNAGAVHNQTVAQYQCDQCQNAVSMTHVTAIADGPPTVDQLPCVSVDWERYTQLVLDRLRNRG